MIAIALLLVGWEPIEEVNGLAQYYADGIMQQVANRRIEWGHIPADTDYRYCVAVTDCSWLGKDVRVEWPNGDIMWGTVCDCSAEADKQRHIDKGLAVEVSWWAANKYAHPIGPYLLPRDGPLDGVRVMLMPSMCGEWN